MSQSVDARSAWLALSLSSLLLLAGAATAEEAVLPAPDSMEIESETQPAAETPRPLIPVTFAGVQVFVDAETGRLRPPTAEEAAELNAAMKAMFQTKTPVHEPVVHKSGMMSLVVGADHLNYSTAHVDENGDLHFECSNGVDDAVASLFRAPIAREEM